MTTTELKEELAAAIAAGNRALARAATASTPDEMFAPPARPLANVVACVSVPSRSVRGLLHVVAIVEAGPDDYGYVCGHCPAFEFRNHCSHCAAAEEVWMAHLDSLELFDDGPVDFDAPEPWETNQRMIADDYAIDAAEYADAGCAIAAVVEPDDGFVFNFEDEGLVFVPNDSRKQRRPATADDLRRAANTERAAKQARAYSDLYGA